MPLLSDVELNLRSCILGLVHLHQYRLHLLPLRLQERLGKMWLGTSRVVLEKCTIIEKEETWLVKMWRIRLHALLTFFDAWVRRQELHSVPSAGNYNFEASKGCCDSCISVFYPLLDDCPLPYDTISSSELLITHFRNANAVDNASDIEEGNMQEFERGFLMVVAADSPGLQVRDKNGLWYLADISLRTGEVLLITGKTFQYVTSGLSYASVFREAPLTSTTVPGETRRVSLMFRLIPRGDASLDGTIMKSAGRAVSGTYGPIQASKFLDNLNVEDMLLGVKTENNMGRKHNSSSHPTLKSLLVDPVSGTILDDAYAAAGCGHSFGGETLKTVKETKVCTSCGASVDVEAMVPNLVLRAVAKAFNKGEKRRRLKIASRKRKRELLGRRNAIKKLKTPKESSSASQDGSEQGRAFLVNEKVLIKGNKRTPEKLVGKEAFVTSKCLNGWYLLKLAHNGESVRLQYRSLEAIEEVKGVKEEPMQEEDSKPAIK